MYLTKTAATPILPGSNPGEETVVAFAMRALELYGRHIWVRSAVLRALDVIARAGLDTLVLHEADLLRMVTCPAPEEPWRDASARYDENAIANNRVWLEHVCRLANERGVRVMVEVEAIGFPDKILEHGIDVFLSDFPLVAGIISSVGPAEGKPAPQIWYGAIIGALHRAVARHDKVLAVRAFADTPEDLAPLLAAIDAAPGEVVLCAKATAHDFYLDFPDNPAIGRSGRGCWMEYDTMGRFWGWGVFPCMPLQDMRARFAHARRNGVSGGVFRVAWAPINDLWSLDGLNAVNLFLAAALAAGKPADPLAACAMWLEGAGWPVSAAEWLADLLGRTEAIVRGALYLDGMVFADNAMFPRGLGRAWWGMEVRDALHPWAPERAAARGLDGGRVADLLDEKRDAEEAARDLAATVGVPVAGVPDALRAALAPQFEGMAVWVEGFRRCAEVCLLARWGQPEHCRDRGPGPADLFDFAAALDGLEAFSERIRPLTERAEVPHQVAMLMDWQRVANVAREGRAALQAYL